MLDGSVAQRSVFNSSDVDPRDRFDAWAAASNDAFVPLEAAAEDRRSFSGSLISQEIGLMHVAEVVGQAMTVRRTTHTISRSNPELMKFGLQVKGRGLVAQDGREAILNPGDFAMYDTTRPYDLRFDGDYRMVVVMFRADLLTLGVKARNSLTASRMSGQSGLGALTRSLLGTLGRQVHDGDARSELAVSDALLAMISGTSAEHIGAEAPQSGRHTVMLGRVTDFITSHLGDPTLTVNSIAEAHNVSVRYLQKMFEDEADTVSDRVRRLRLAACQRDLTNPLLTGRSVSSIGMRWGFSDAAVFSRAFRRHFGTSPAELRRLSQMSST